MAQTLSSESLPLFTAATARATAKAEAEKALQDARDLLSKADTEYHEAFLEGGSKNRRYLATIRRKAAQDNVARAKETLRQLS